MHFLSYEEKEWGEIVTASVDFCDIFSSLSRKNQVAGLVILPTSLLHCLHACAMSKSDCLLCKSQQGISQKTGPVKAGQIFFWLFLKHQLSYCKKKIPQLKYTYLNNQVHCNPMQGPLLGGEIFNFRCVSQNLSKRGRNTSTLEAQKTNCFFFSLRYSISMSIK